MNYIDRDGILEEILKQERDARQRRRGYFKADQDADVIRTSLKQHITNSMSDKTCKKSLKQNYISRYVVKCFIFHFSTFSQTLRKIYCLFLFLSPQLPIAFLTFLG